MLNIFNCFQIEPKMLRFIQKYGLLHLDYLYEVIFSN